MASTTTKLNNLINPEVMGDTIEAKIEASAKLIPYAKVDTTGGSDLESAPYVMTIHECIIPNANCHAKKRIV